MTRFDGAELLFADCFTISFLAMTPLFVHGLRFGTGRVFVGIDPDVNHGTLAGFRDRFTRAQDGGIAPDPVHLAREEEFVFQKYREAADEQHRSPTPGSGGGGPGFAQRPATSGSYEGHGYGAGFFSRYDQGSRPAGYAASDASEAGFHRGTPKMNETPRTWGDETPMWAPPRRAW